ncbi:uncharacterized protein LOC120005324 [Tripterygium wilfordii]|uniref:uncharacterized protein LOC120005324 n=1 Tax=Tripterygium wilfordii TaxID=458696 RepID=UPI0018F8281D|nr:uncharacterized protein LOC120005324 [Tripterygium wilfordii]
MTPQHYATELDTATTDSVTSSPRSEYSAHENNLRVRFMCSFGGQILPRPNDNQLRYVGGDTRIFAIHRSSTFSALLIKLAKLSGCSNFSVKYQLPNEDLDALISVTTDEDVENMMEEYERLSNNHNPKAARLRLFLFNKGDSSRASSISSLLEGSANRQHWFLDALNGGGAGLERGRSEVSSIVSEVPDYLFGLDNPDESQPPREPRMKTRTVIPDNVSASDPGSPAPVVQSPFCSTSSASNMPYMPDLPPVKTKPDNPEPNMQVKENDQPLSQPMLYSGNPVLQYMPEPHYSGPPVQPYPVYYVSGPVHPGMIPTQQVQPLGPYMHQVPVQTNKIPVGYHQPVHGMGQAYGAGTRPMDPYDVSARVVTDGTNQQLYYGVTHAGAVPMYPGMVMPGGEELQRTGSDVSSTGRV